MIFIESPAFTEDVKELLTDERYTDLQLHLAKEKKILRKLNEEWH